MGINNFIQKTENKLVPLIFLIIPLLFGVVSLFLGRDVNWDVKNYHYYNAYAFVEHRLDFDIAPAQLQTYINPIGDLPFYWMVKHFPAWVAGFVLGCIHGFNISLIFLIFWDINNYSQKWSKILWGICLVIISSIAPGFISELGNTMHDNLVSLFVLATIFLLIRASKKLRNNETKFGLLHIGIAGLIIGVGFGIKPSIAIFIASTAIAFSVFSVRWPIKMIALLIYSIAGIFGGLASAGFWWWELWIRFGNPFFPFYNNIFKSPYFTSAPVVWTTFLPNGLWEYLVWPFIFSFNGLRVNQSDFSDVRFALLYLLCMAWLIVYVAKKIFRINLMPDGNQIKYSFDLESSNYLLLFFLCSYLFWIKESSTYRFMIPLELLVPLCFLILLERFVSSRRVQIGLITIAILATFAFFKPFNWGRLSWGDSYFYAQNASRLDPSKQAVVVMLGRSPTAYVVPDLPSSYRFIRPEGNITMEGGENNQFIGKIKKLLEEYSGPLYILYNQGERNFGFNLEASLAKWGLTINYDSCFILKISIPDRLSICQAFNHKK